MKRCGFCGRPTLSRFGVCRAHRDLLALDPHYDIKPKPRSSNGRFLARSAPAELTTHTER